MVIPLPAAKASPAKIVPVVVRLVLGKKVALQVSMQVAAAQEARQVVALRCRKNGPLSCGIERSLRPASCASAGGACALRVVVVNVPGAALEWIGMAGGRYNIDTPYPARSSGCCPYPGQAAGIAAA